MASLDTLAAFGSELTTEQLDEVEGGFIVVATIVVLAAFDAGLWGYILTR